MEKLRFLKPNDRIWIGQSLSPIPPGTYYRYSIYENGDIKNVAFKKLDLEENVYSLVDTPVHIDHHPPRNFPGDTIARDYHPLDKNWGIFKPYQSPQRVEGFYPPLTEPIVPILSVEKIREIANFQESIDYPICIYTPAAKYKKECKIKGEKSVGFCIENGALKDSCPINELVGVFINKVLQTTNILWRKTKSGHVNSSTFKLPKIKGVRKLICQS